MTDSLRDMNPTRRILLLAWRGWTKACPNCGQRGLFDRWFVLKPTCPRCGITFEREEGYWTGAMGANIIVTEFVFLGVMIVSLVITWPDPPVLPIILGAVLLNAIFPIVFYPFSKTVWMAFDLAFNPPENTETRPGSHDWLDSRRRSGA